MRASMAAFSRRATASVRSFSLTPPAPRDAFVVAAVTGVDDDDAKTVPGRRRAARRAAPGACGTAGFGAAGVGGGGGGGGGPGGSQLDHQPARSRIALDAELRGARAELDHEIRTVHAHRLREVARAAPDRRRVERGGVEPNRRAGCRRGRSCAASAAGRRAGAARPARSAPVRPLTLRHAHVADENQLRLTTDFDPGADRGTQRHREKLDRHLPAAALALNLAGQRDDALADAHERLSGKREDPLAARGDDHAADARCLPRSSGRRGRSAARATRNRCCRCCGRRSGAGCRSCTACTCSARTTTRRAATPPSPRPSTAKFCSPASCDR